MSGYVFVSICVVTFFVYNMWERWLESKERIARINSEWADDDDAGQCTTETETTVTKEEPRV